MNAEGGLILILGLMFGTPALLVVLYLLNRIAGRTIVPLWLPIASLFVMPVAGSLYLDFAGEVRSLKVVEKNEKIQHDPNFSRNWTWSRRFTVRVEHPWEDEQLTPYLGMGADAETFDRLHVGQMVDVRVYELSRLFKFGRLANRSTFSMIADWFPRQPRGPWHESTATVDKIYRFTEDRGIEGVRTPLPWPYQIVRLRFTPPGFEQPIEVMDNIEIASMPALAEQTTVKIIWPEGDPRSARLASARPGAPWANWFYVLGENLALPAAVLGLLLIWAVARRRRKRTARQGETPP